MGVFLWARYPCSPYGLEGVWMMGLHTVPLIVLISAESLSLSYVTVFVTLRMWSVRVRRDDGGLRPWRCIYRGTSSIRNCHPVGPYRRPMPRDMRGS